MKTNLLTLIIFISFKGSLIAQNSGFNNRPQYAITIEAPPLYVYKDKVGKAKFYSFQLGVEANWRSKKHLNSRYSFNLQYAKLVDNYNKALILTDFTMLLGSKHHFLELGVGMDSQLLLNGVFGYRLYLKDNFLFKLQFLPSLYVPIDFINDEIYSYLHISAGIGYQFNPRNSDAISSSFTFIGKRLSIQAMSYPISFDEPGSIIPSLVFDLDFLILEKDSHSFSIHGGSGFLLEGSIFSQVGLNYLYGREAHFLELSTNLCFTELSNPNLDWDESSYRLLQTQIGYRYQCKKLPVFARIAYAPYIRTLDWKREGGLKHNMVLGVGYRFAK